jgi:hypothetical protein
VWCLSDMMSVRCLRTFCPIPSRSHFGPIMPTTLGNTTPPRWTSPDHAKTQRDAARRRDQKNQSQRRRRAELTPSNKDVAKALDNQSRRRKRAERSPEDAQRRKAMDTLWRRRLNGARAAGRGRVLESMS